MGVLSPKNPPTSAQMDSDPSNFYSATTFNFQLNAGDSQIGYIPVQVAFRPSTLILSDTTNTKVETTCNPASDITGGTALWNTETPLTGRMTFAGVITGIRITNTGSGSIQAVLAT